MTLNLKPGVIGATGGGETTSDLASFLEAEIKAAAGDIDRARANLGQTRRVHGSVSARIGRYRRALQLLEAEEAELAAKIEAEKRILTSRRKTLFDLETEAAE